GCFTTKDLSACGHAQADADRLFVVHSCRYPSDLNSKLPTRNDEEAIRMNLDAAHAYLMAKKGAPEEWPFDLETPVYKVMGKMSALLAPSMTRYASRSSATLITPSCFAICTQQSLSATT
ncbi:MAG: hypothetical protein U9Q94_02915, partial [Candidatus Bipolaricaulota bacterium]|nr:hypothetical protein [Candidatus Bipolaricaulota bacterium]